MGLLKMTSLVTGLLGEATDGDSKVFTDLLMELVMGGSFLNPSAGTSGNLP